MGGKHRVIAHRICACGCGREFDVTTHNPDRICFSRACVHRYRPNMMREGQHERVLRQREDKFGDMLDGMLREGQNLKRSRLLEFAQDLFRLGYWSGYAARHRGAAPIIDEKRSDATDSSGDGAYECADNGSIYGSA